MLRQQAKTRWGIAETPGIRPVRPMGAISSAPALPADDRAGDGYDWMDTLDVTAWSVLPNWGSEGCDARVWPYVIIAAGRTSDRNGGLFAYATYAGGDALVQRNGKRPARKPALFCLSMRPSTLVPVAPSAPGRLIPAATLKGAGLLVFPPASIGAVHGLPLFAWPIGPVPCRTDSAPCIRAASTPQRRKAPPLWPCTCGSGSPAATAPPSASGPHDGGR